MKRLLIETETGDLRLRIVYAGEALSDELRVRAERDADAAAVDLLESATPCGPFELVGRGTDGAVLEQPYRWQPGATLDGRRLLLTPAD